jgi:putative ABC transport system permease protein
MSLAQCFRMAIKSIVSNRIRSFLTMLGVIIGVAAVIIATSYVEGSTQKITASVQSLGTNLIQVTVIGRNSNKDITYSDMVKFQQKNSDVIGAIAPSISTTVTAKMGDQNTSTTLIGTSPDYSSIKNTNVQSGRFINQMDITDNQKVAVVGTAVINAICPGTNPINSTIKINGMQFQIVGVLQQTNNGQTGTTDDEIIIPVTVATRLNKNANIRSFVMEATTSDTANAAVSRVNTFLYNLYRNTSDYRVSNMAQMLSSLNSITSILMLVVGGIASIALLVGGIGIMNIMLVSVTERTKEIGIRKAIGAKRGSILSQFLIEALMVTGIGGLAGVLIGVSVIKFIIGGFHLTAEVYPINWILISFGFSLIIGVVFGMYPANKAANLNPIDALMFE